MNIIKKIFKSKISQTLPYILLIGGVIGLYASLTLTVEHIDLIKDPNHQLSCSLDPVLACGPVINSKQAEAFGFPNPLVGLAVFGAQVMLALAMFAGARMKAWFWKLYSAGILGGIAFTLWLMFETLYRIEALCIYCICVWIVMFTSGWYVLQYMLSEKHIKVDNKFINFIRRHHFDILLIWFLIIIGVILNRFWYYYGPKLGF